jgi:predicted hydrolase (HD superfamily)
MQTLRILQVQGLTQVQDWTQAHHTELLVTNEQLEKMLLALDSLTGLQGALRDKKKARIREISKLCMILDNMWQNECKEPCHD